MALILEVSSPFFLVHKSFLLLLFTIQPNGRRRSTRVLPLKFKQSQTVRTQISWTLRFWKFQIIPTKPYFPSPVNHCNFTPELSNLPIIRTNLLFCQGGFKKPGFRCSHVLNSSCSREAKKGNFTTDLSISDEYWRERVAPLARTSLLFWCLFISLPIFIIIIIILQAFISQWETKQQELRENSQSVIVSILMRLSYFNVENNLSFLAMC